VTSLTQNREAGMQIRALSAHTGAELRGIDLTQPIAAATRDLLSQAFVHHSVLVIRDQSLTPRQLPDAVPIFGAMYRVEPSPEGSALPMDNCRCSGRHGDGKSALT